MTTDSVTIRRLTLHVTDPPHARRGRDEWLSAARPRFERLANEINWRPAGCQARQVWVVRRLDLPPQISGGDERHWIAAVESQLAERFRRAVRVGPSTPPEAVANADSLLFDDRAAWLALLTADTVAGHVWSRWPWAAALPEGAGRHRGALLAAAWSRFAEFLPAALDALPAAQSQQAVALLTPAEAGRVVSALHERFALPRDVFGDIVPDGPAGEGVPLPPAPWARWSPPGALTPRAHYLHGLTLGLARAPAVARSAAFARAAAGWLGRALAEPRPVPIPPASPPSPGRVAAPPAVSLSVAADTAAEPVVASAAVPPSDSPHAPVPTATRDEPPVGDDPTAPNHQAAQPTQLGGVLFLINALAWLDLPRLAGEHVGGWGWVELLARALLGDDAPPDPIWDALRQLDGRDAGQFIGAGWTPDAFALSPRTVRRYLMGEWRVAAGGGRLVLARGEVMVSDSPLAGPAAPADMAAALRPYVSDDLPRWVYAAAPPAVPSADNLRAVAADGARWWLARAMPALRHLLRRGLGDATLGDDAIARRLLWRPGHLEITRTHVDLFLPLDATDVALRRAGLDLDPGWSPDYGHIILFHYE